MSDSLFEMQIRGHLLSSPIEVLSVEGDEAINELYSFNVRFSADARDELPSNANLLLSQVELTLLPDAGRAKRHLHGVITSVTAETATALLRHVLRIELAPKMALLDRRQHCRIFQDSTVIEVVTALLEEHGVSYRLRLLNQYPKRAYCVQYHETDLVFIQRLLGEIGVAFYFDHSSSRGESNRTSFGQTEVLVLLDTAEYYSRLSDPSELHYRPLERGQSALESPENSVSALVQRREASRAVRLERAYDFQRPTTDLASSARENAQNDRFFGYSFGGTGAESPPEFELAAVRLQQDRARMSLIEGRSGSRRLAPAQVFSLQGHTIPVLDADYVVTRVRHHAYASAYVPPGAPLYTNVFSAIPSKVLARPSIQPRVLQQVTETAVVVGPKGQDSYIDDVGRIKVQFHWDLTGGHNESSSCWIRVAQSMAGAGWGAQFIPRIGQEVVVTFLGGNLDRPLVTGAVYNATHPLPFSLPDGLTKSGWRTQTLPGGRGFNELSFDDAMGRERVYIRAQRDLDELIENDHTQVIGHNAKTTIQGSVLRTILRDQHEEITGNKVERVAGDHSVSVSGARSLTVGPSSSFEHIVGPRTAIIDGAELLEVRGPTTQHYANSVMTSVNGPLTHLVGRASQPASSAHHVEGTQSLSSTGRLDLRSDTEILFSVGSSVIRLTPDRIDLIAKAISHQADGATLDLSDHRLKLSADEAAQLTTKSAVIKSDQASLTMKNEVRIDGTRILLNSPGHAVDNIAEPEKKTRFELVDQDGRPLGGQRFILRLSDNSERTGFLREDGSMDMELPVGGTILFPDLTDVREDH